MNLRVVSFVVAFVTLAGACGGGARSVDYRLQVSDLPSGYHLSDRQKPEDVRFYMCAAPKEAPVARGQHNYAKSDLGPYIASTVSSFAEVGARRYVEQVVAATKCASFKDPAGCTATITHVEGSAASRRVVITIHSQCTDFTLDAAYILVRVGDHVAEVEYDPNGHGNVDQTLVKRLESRARARLK